MLTLHELEDAIYNNSPHCGCDQDCKTAAAAVFGLLVSKGLIKSPQPEPPVDDKTR